jgi:hypothetical protein
LLLHGVDEAHVFLFQIALRFIVDLRKQCPIGLGEVEIESRQFGIGTKDLCQGRPRRFTVEAGPNLIGPSRPHGREGRENGNNQYASNSRHR